MPDLTTSTASEHATLPLSSKLSLRVQKAHIIPNLNSSTLLSVGQLCDNNCDVIFQKDQVHVLHKTPEVKTLLTRHPPILLGHRNHTNGLWDMDLIPARRTVLHQDNCNLPPLHPQIYPSRVPTPPATTPQHF